jgi:glycosyltransferase involved in cell wall biosynthesis
MQDRYVIITPARNEEAFLDSTIESVISQTARPIEWVIVNDGSTDRTQEILDEYAQAYGWIRLVQRPDRGFRQNGGGVMEAFFNGLWRLKTPGWEFLVKLDADVSFEPRYFERLFAEFRADPKLGIGGGTIYYEDNGARRFEVCPSFHVRGATKVYRRACWEAIGGLISAPGWDTIDELKANMLGWRTKTFADIQLRHYRPTSSGDARWGGYVKDGRADYVAGYHPLYMLAKFLTRLGQRPYVIGALALSYGFISGYLRRLPRVDDRALVRYVRKQQLGRLFGGETIWRGAPKINPGTPSARN